MIREPSAGESRPLAEALPSPATSELLGRTWARIEATRRRRRRTRVAIVVAVPLALAASLLFLLRVPGADVASADVAQTSVLRLSATSWVELGAHADVEVAQKDLERVHLELARGRVRVTVDPAERRKWTVTVRPAPRVGMRCDPVEVSVIGTVFVVEKTDAAVTVSVERGSVGVHGPGTERRLGADDVATIPLSCVPAAAPALDAIAISRVEEGEEAAIGTSAEAGGPWEPKTLDAAPVAPSLGVWDPGLHLSELQELAAPVSARRPPPSRRPISAAGAAPLLPIESPEPVAPPPPTVEPLSAVLARSDAARAAGDVAGAASILVELLRQRSHEPGAGVASYTLARLHEAEGLDRKAAEAYEKADRLGLPTALREAAVARAFQAWRRAGDSDRAARGAADYLARYPDGGWAGAAQDLAAP